MNYTDKVREIAEVASDVLNEWECDFIENIRGKANFTYRQEVKIDELYQKVCDSLF